MLDRFWLIIYNKAMEFKNYVFKSKMTGEYWLCRGATVVDKYKATIFNAEQAARFFRTVRHPNKWIKEEILCTKNF